MKDALTITQVLCTRLCHDLAGPIGAVAAGVELAGDDPSQVDAETLQLLANSAAAAARKLKFLRIAMGTAGGGPAGKDFQTTVMHYFEAIAGPSGPARVEWPAADVFAHLANAGKGQGAQILANLILVAAEVVPRLRSVLVSLVKSGDALTITADAKGDISAQMDPRTELVKILSAPDEAAVTPKSVQALYAHALVSQSGGTLSASATDGGFKASATLALAG